MELDEGVYKGVECFVHRSVLVDGEEVEGAVELCGLLLGEIGSELEVFLLVSEFVLLGGSGDLGLLLGGLEGIELFKVEGVGVGALHHFVDEGGDVLQKDEAQSVFLPVVGQKVLFVLVDVVHEPAEVDLVDQYLSISLVLILGV